MKKLNFRTIFLLIIAFALFLTGCSVDLTYTVKDFELKDEVSNLYVNEYSNDTESVIISDIIQCNHKKAVVNFYFDEAKTESISTSSVLIVEGDNFVYATIDFGNGTVTDVILNLYRLKLFKVSFKTNCGIKIEEQYVEENSCAVEPTEELKRTGYGFIGWDYKFSKPITKDIVIEAKWKANTYTVTYETEGGEIEVDSTIVTYGEPYELDVPTREGYIFKGWKYNGRLLSTEKWLIANDVTVQAVWEAETRTYEIEYIIVGAVGPHLQRTFTNKEEVVLRIPYKNGYRFIGWYYESDFSGEKVEKIPVGTEQNITLYSRWEKFKLEGAKISFLGDSISTFYSPDSSVNSFYTGTDQFFYPRYSTTVKTVEKTWWYKVIEATKTTLLVNESWSGTACYNNGSEVNSGAMNYNRINNLKGSDIVVVFIGTNDNVNGHSIANFTNAYNTMLKRIREVCPYAYIFCCTMGYSGCSLYSYKEATRIAYNDIIREAVVNYDAEVIEISDIQTQDNYKAMLEDSLHLNADGMIVVSNKVIEVIKNYVGA